MSGESSSAALVVIDDDSLRGEGDEEVQFISLANHYNGSNNISRPADMDPASWALIQRLEQGEDSDDDVIEVVGVSRKRERKELNKNINDDDDRSSVVLAIRLQAEEEQTRRMEQDREKLDMAVASRLQEEENILSTNFARKPQLSKEDVLKALKPCQSAAIDYVTSRAQKMHNDALPLLEKRVIALGFTSNDVHQCLAYMKDDAPIIIHLTEYTLSQLVKDSHYRNLFETKTSGGQKKTEVREYWENNMFGNCYTSSCPAFDRPKYGCLNITGDIAGVHSARYYGNLFLILHQQIRHRSTFYDKDSGNYVATTSLATAEYYAHILQGYDDNDLKAALGVCSARVRGAPSHCSVYKEVQIHGPVSLETDIQALSVPGRQKDASKQLMEYVLEFQKKTNCNILWQGDLISG